MALEDGVQITVVESDYAALVAIIVHPLCLIVALHALYSDLLLLDASLQPADDDIQPLLQPVADKVPVNESETLLTALLSLLDAQRVSLL